MEKHRGNKATAPGSPRGKRTENAMQYPVRKENPKSKKARKREERRIWALQKQRACTIAGLIQGMLHQTEDNLTLAHSKYTKQLERIRRWSDELLSEFHGELGYVTVQEAIKTVHRVSGVIDSHVPTKGYKTVGHYGAMWIVLGYLADEAKHEVEYLSGHRAWNFLASCTNTWAAMMLAEAPEDGLDYEKMAGEILDDARAALFE